MSLVTELVKIYDIVDNQLKLIGITETLADASARFPGMMYRVYSAKHTYNKELEVFENDKDKDYGWSSICCKDDGLWDITMCKHRLSLDILHSHKLCNAWDNIVTGAHWNEGTTLAEVLKHHFDWWCREEKLDSLAIPYFKLTSEEVKLLLEYGFSSNTLLCEIEYTEDYTAYEVNLEESFIHKFTVKAKDDDDAVKQIKDLYNRGKYHMSNKDADYLQAELHNLDEDYYTSWIELQER